MLSNILALIVQVFLVEPLTAEVSERLGAANASAQLVGEVRACASAAVPALAQRVQNDPEWAVRTAFGIWIGGALPVGILAEASPNCGATVQAAEVYLRGQASS